MVVSKTWLLIVTKGESEEVFLAIFWLANYFVFFIQEINKKTQFDGENLDWDVNLGFYELVSFFIVVILHLKVEFL